LPSRKWRVEARPWTTGTHYRLLTGRDGTRVRVNLGLVSREQAEVALVRLQRLEDEERIARWLGWYGPAPDDAVAALVSDVDLARALDPRPDFGAMPLTEYVDACYREWRAADRPRTWKREAWVLDQVLLDLGRHRLREVDAHVVADYLDRLVCRSGARKGKAMAGNTKRLRRAAVQAVLHRAYRLKHIPTEPDLAVFELRDSTKTVRAKSEPLTMDELFALMDASSPRHRAMWATGAGQGLRPSELVRLDWQGVDWRAGTIAIPPDETGEGKTDESVAVVPMTPLVLDELRLWWVAQGQPARGLMFPSATGARYAEGGFRRALKDAAKRAGLVRVVNPYLLRDSFATICWALDIDMDSTRRMMRHADEAMLRRVYQRPRPAELAARMARFVRPGSL
jgi:integrase